MAEGDRKGGTARRGLRWTDTRRKIYVRVLAETYRPEDAMEAADFTWAEVCELRVRHPDFAVRIDEVMVAGFDRLEARFLFAAMKVLETEKPDLALVQAVMKLRRPARSDAAPAKPSAADRKAREALIQSIMSKIAPLQAAQAGGGTDGETTLERSRAGGFGRSGDGYPAGFERGDGCEVGAGAAAARMDAA